MTAEPDYTHVHENIRPFLEIEGRRRLHDCWDRIWVPTPSTKEAFIALSDCLNAPSSTKPRGLVITGDSDSGKSRTLTAFRARHKPDIAPGAEYAEFPVVLIQAPDKPSRTAVFKSILAELGHPILYNASEDDLRRHTVNMIRGCKVGAVMIDEFHDISRERMSNQLVEFLRFVKSLINETGRPFVIAGVPAVLDIIASEKQMAGRFETVVELRPFTRPEFAKILLSFEKVLPLRNPSNLRDRKNAEIAHDLFARSGGLIGRLSTLLHDACRIAIESKVECLTPEIVRAIPERAIEAARRRAAG